MIFDYATTIEILKYIAESPPQEVGGFHENTINAAKSALHYLHKSEPLNDMVRDDKMKLLDDCIKEFKEIAKCGLVSKDVMRSILARAAELEGK